MRRASAVGEGEWGEAAGAGALIYGRDASRTR